MRELIDYDGMNMPTQATAVSRWQCFRCGSIIKPNLRVLIEHSESRAPQQRKFFVPLFTPQEIRNLVEFFLDVDFNYRNPKSRSLNEFKDNRFIFWNLIYYFKR